MREKLYAAVDSCKEEMLRNLEQLIAIPSVSSNIPKVKEALSFCLALGDRMGMRAYSAVEEQVGIIEMAEGDETLGILTHVDVVPVGDLGDWNTPPFQMTIKEGRAYGRGTVDDKGMVIASLYAMKAVKELGLPVHKRVQLIIGTQEETEWVDMKAYVKNHPLPDYGFTPDGEYPICNIEKGSMDIKMVFDVSEEDKPGGIYISSCNIGVASNTVPGRAFCVLSNGEHLEVTGRSVHSCQPEKGENALFNLASALSGLALADTRFYKLLKAIDRDLSDCFGRPLGLYSSSEHFGGEFVHRNALSPTILKYDGKTAELNVNLRYPYGASPQDIIEIFSRWAAQFGGKVANVHELPAVFVPKDAPFLSIFARAYENVSGMKNEFTLAYGGSYAKAMPNVVSWGPLFPGEEDTCHEPNEYISIDSLMRSAKIFAEAIYEIVTTKDYLKG